MNAPQLEAEISLQNDHIAFLQTFKREIDGLITEATEHRVRLIRQLGEVATDGE